MRAVDRLKADGYPEVIGVKCHVGNAEDRQNLFAEAVKQFGGVDILVSNAAVNPAQVQVLETPESSWDKIFDVNVKASFLLAKEAKSLMLQRGGGSILFVSSIAAYYNVEVCLLKHIVAFRVNQLHYFAESRSILREQSCTIGSNKVGRFWARAAQYPS